MPSVPAFCGPSYQAQSPIIDNEIAMNCYVETSEAEGAATRRALLHTPGKEVFAQIAGENAAPDLFEINGRGFVAASNLYEVDESGNVTNWGSIGSSPTTPPMMTANETQLVILNNGNLYVFTLATNILTAVNMGQFNGPVAQIGFSDGYVVATLQDSHTFQQSNLEDATTWSGLNVAIISYFPDNITSLSCDHREVIFFSRKKTVVYYNSGAGFPVFIPIQGQFLETGAYEGATYATAQLAEQVFFLSQDERGQLMAKALVGANAKRISTHAVELFWQSYALANNDQQISSWTYQEYGHEFWVLRFPVAGGTGVGATWAYDATEEQWAQRGFWLVANGTYIADRATSHMLFAGKHLVGDWASGTIYQLSSDFLTDFGNPIRGLRRTAQTAKENKWIYFDELEFVMQTGINSIPILDDSGNQIGTRAAQIVLRWSNDGGQTWSNEYYLSLGEVGEYGKRVIKRMLGRARKRIWEVYWTDAYPIRFNDAFWRGTLENV